MSSWLAHWCLSALCPISARPHVKKCSVGFVHSRGGQRTLVTPGRAWRVTYDTPPRIAERVDVLDPSLDVPGSAAVIAALSVVDAARPAAHDLVSLLKDLSNEPDSTHFESSDEGDSSDDEGQEVGRDLQLAAKWAMRTLNDAIERGGSLDEPVPLLARRDGRHEFSESPFVADDPLLAETWEPVFAILDADRDLRRLHSALHLRNLDNEVTVVPDPREPLSDRRLEVDQWIVDAKPYLAAVAIDQVPSRQSTIMRGLARLEVVVCENLVLRYELDGEVRQRTDAVSYIATRIEQEGMVRRRIGTVHLEVDDRNAAPHWYAFGPQLAQFLEVPNLGDAFALLLSAGRSERDQYLSARRISFETVDEARLELARPQDERELEDLITPSVAQRPLIGDGNDQPPSDAFPDSDAPGLQDDDEELEPEAPKDIEMPLIDFDLLSVRDMTDFDVEDTDEAVRRVVRRSGLGPSGPFDHEATNRLRRKIGNRGEEAAFEAEKRRLTSFGGNPDLVVWRSQQNEFAPYDIESQDEDGQLIYIEVKSTTSDDSSEPFDISEAELLFALRKRSRYYVYRVTSAHLAVPNIDRYQDPIGRLQQNAATLRFSGARLAFATSSS